MNTNQNKPMFLRAVVAELLSHYAQVNSTSSIQIINSVSSECLVTRKKNWLAPLMGDLYSILADVKENDQIYISAREVNGEYQLYAAQKNVTKPNDLKTSTDKHCPRSQFYPQSYVSGAGLN
ncbi:MAG: hypothetical protein JWM28_584 [Chitinophagaceae bacterium]|nr:hypothetical protein [Chitinophagaceae bacterium]